MLDTVDFIEKFVIRVLILMLLLAIVLGTCELGRVMIYDIIRPPFVLLDIPTVFELFGIILVILIGMELLRSMKMFLTDDSVKPELVIEVAMIALCNKIITLDVSHLPEGIPIGIATLLLALSAAYFVLRRVNGERSTAADKMSEE